MKSTNYFLLILLAVYVPCKGQNIDTLYKKADSLLFEQKQYAQAITEFKKILAMPQDKANNRLVTTNINLGIAYYRLRDYENASSYYNTALRLLGPENNRNRAIIYNQLGLLFKDLKENKTALANFKKAYAIYPFKELLSNMAYTYIEMDEADSALYYHRLGIQGATKETAFTSQVLFVNDYRALAPEKAYELLLQLIPEKGFAAIDKYYLLMGRYHLWKNNPEAASSCFGEGLANITDLFVKIDLLTELNCYTEALKLTNYCLESAENYSSRLKIAEKQYIIFNRIIQEELDKGNLEGAFMNTDRSKSIALRASLDITDEYKTVKEVQQHLLENELLLSYKILHDTLLLIWEVDPDSLKLHKKSIGEEFYHSLDEYMLTHSTFNLKLKNKFNRFCKSSYNTRNNLLGGINIEGKDIVIVPEERFYNLSFDGLITAVPDTSHRRPFQYKELDYMVYHNTFRYVYRASLNDRNTQYSAFSVLHILPDSLRPRLKGSWKLHEKIKGFTTLLNDVYLIKKYEALKDNYSILHFDTHGRLNLDSSLYSYMQFGLESLYVKDIIESKVSNDMLILSACNTGVGSVTKGEGGISFERAFILAGGKTIITSFWPGFDGSSYKIFPKFYEEIRKGKRPEKAMQLAKINYFKLQEKLDTEPFLWANYCVVGQSSSFTEFPVRAKNLKLILLGGLAIVVITLLTLFCKKFTAKVTV